MKISYKWLSEYLPQTIDPERLSRILTSIGLEVESIDKYEEIKGGLKGLVVGEVLTTEKHPNADKLTLTQVNIGAKEPLQIVCGAPNVAAGQKVIVAPVGTTIYPSSGDAITMKNAKIRGMESQGMICAEDEIGLGTSHAGILVLPPETKVGMTVTDYFKPYDDLIYEIGLTPNRMDAMSHWGVARDVAAYLSHHDKKGIRSKIPTTNSFKTDSNSLPFTVIIANEAACPRYSGITVNNVTIKESPLWLQQRLRSIGVRPINNVVDVTNYIQHETGQPLHAFDSSAIKENKIVVTNLAEGTSFITLDDKERKLNADDLMICSDENNELKPLCIAGVFGGADSGVTNNTTSIFLESACFDAVTIRKTSFSHQLRTDAASRFEKGTDISATVPVLKRAAMMIKEMAGGELSSDIIDIYPQQQERSVVAIKYHYLKKLSGKNYHPDAVKEILVSLGFEIAKEGMDELRVVVPYHKPDVNLPADIVEEVLRIDGLDNVSIPESITITPSVETDYALESYKEKLAGYLVGSGFNEIMTNSITNDKYFAEEELAHAVKMLNSLSAELNIMRPSMLETGLEAVAHNLKRRNFNLRFFEFGKTYSTKAVGHYEEPAHLCLYLTGASNDDGWKSKGSISDFYSVKGIAEQLLLLSGINDWSYNDLIHPKFDAGLEIILNNKSGIQLGVVGKKVLERFDIKQPVFFADLNWQLICSMAAANKLKHEEIAKYPTVQRDLAVIVPSSLQYRQLEESVKKLRLTNLEKLRLFDIFESNKLGEGKKSLAVNFTFLDKQKTLTDKEIDGWMNKIMSTLENDLKAEIRKG